MKKILLQLLVLLLMVGTAGAWYFLRHDHTAGHSNSVASKSLAWRKKLDSKGVQAEQWIRKNQYNPSYCFLVDMSMESGQNRFFVYSLEGDSILAQGLVTHGRCNENWLEGRKYDNRIGCGCTSLGHYKIGGKYTGRFGTAFKLHGLDSTNSNAYTRYVVLHSHECVPEAAVHPAPICQSDGCPTVSPQFLLQLEKYISKSKQPVLLWMYE